MTEVIPKQKHSLDTAIYSLSKAFERASFYGIRALIVLHLMDTFYNNSKSQIIELYAWFIFAITIAKIIGALVGDFLIKPRNAIIIGGFLQTAGSFVICINSFEITLMGMGLIVLGSGLYSPNVLAQFARLYIKKPKIIDAAFAIYLTAINIGSFLGVLLIGIIGINYGYIYGFLTAGIGMLISTLTILFLKEKEIDLASNELHPKIKNKIQILLISFIAVTLFWNLHDFSYIALQEIVNSLGNMPISDVNLYALDIIDSTIAILFFTISAIVWSYFYYNQLKKIIVGFLSLSIGLGIALFISAPYSESSIIIVAIASIFIGIADAHISPVLNAIITRCIHPKFLAVALNISILPGLIIGKLLTNFQYEYTATLDNTAILVIGTSSLGTIGLTLFILVKLGILKTTYSSN